MPAATISDNLAPWRWKEEQPPRQEHTVPDSAQSAPEVERTPYVASVTRDLSPRSSLSQPTVEVSPLKEDNHGQR